MSNTARRTTKKTASSTTSRRRIAVPKPKTEDGGLDSVEALVKEEEDIDLAEQEEDFDEAEGVKGTGEVPESIRKLAEDAMAAADEDDLDNMPVLTIEMIRDAQDRTTEWIAVPEWGGKVQVRSLSAAAMFEMMGGDETKTITEEGGFQLDLSLRSMQKAVITNGVSQPVITDAGFEILIEKSTAPVMAVLNAIMKVSKLGKNKSGKDALTEEIDTFRPTGE